MKQLLVGLILLSGLGCKPPDVTAVAPTYVGVWRAGTTKSDYTLFELYKDKSIKFFGSKHDIMAPADVVGDDITIKPDGKTNPQEVGANFRVHLKRISETKIEITDDSGVFLGVKTPVPFSKITSDQEEETNSAIMTRAMNGG